MGTRSDRPTARTWVLAAFAAGRYDAVISRQEEALEEDGRYLRVMMALLHSHLRTGRLRDALSLADAEKQRLRDYPYARRLLDHAVGRCSLASVLYVCATDDDRHFAYLAEGLLQLSNENPAGARAWFNLVVGIGPAAQYHSFARSQVVLCNKPRRMDSRIHSLLARSQAYSALNMTEAARREAWRALELAWDKRGASDPLTAAALESLSNHYATSPDEIGTRWLRARAAESYRQSLGDDDPLVQGLADDRREAARPGTIVDDPTLDATASGGTSLCRIRALCEIPPFVGPTGETLLLHAGDLASVQPEIAAMLERRECAVILNADQEESDPAPDR